MSQTYYFLMSLVWAGGIIILILAVCALAVRWMISAFKLQREKVMRVFFIVTCICLMITNAGCVFVTGFSHSSVVQELGWCILLPFGWIGDKVGLWNGSDLAPMVCSLIGMWLLVMMTGLYLMRKGRSSFWALLLPPALSMMAYLLSSIMGWEFGM